MNTVLVYLSLILIATIIRSGFINEKFSNSDDKQLQDYIYASEKKIIKMIDNLFQDNTEFRIIEGPPGQLGEPGATGGTGPLPPQLMYNQEHKTQIVSAQEKHSSSDVSNNVSYMIEKPNDKFGIGDNSKWTLINGDSNHFKIQSVKNVDKCLSYDDKNRVFLAQCGDSAYHSDWDRASNNKFKAVDVTDTINNKCLSTVNMSATDKVNTGIPSNNKLELDVCADKTDRKQSWLLGY
jgi:hypothetical protein